MDRIRVLIADDHTVMREGLISLLSRSPVVEVVGEARDGAEAVALARELMPDVIIMDLKMPGLDGAAATERIIAESPHVRVLVLTVSDDSEDLVSAVKVGAKGYLLKDAARESLVNSIEAVHRGESIVSPTMAANLLEEFRKLSKNVKQEPSPLVAKLTDKERKVLDLMVEGLDNKAIAKRIFVSESTVKNHVSNILSKLQLENRVQAAVFAARERLIQSDS